MFDYMGAFLFRNGFAHVDNVNNSPEPSGTFRKLPPEPTPAHTGTLRNVPEVASGIKRLIGSQRLKSAKIKKKDQIQHKQVQPKKHV